VTSGFPQFVQVNSQIITKKWLQHFPSTSFKVYLFIYILLNGVAGSSGHIMSNDKRADSLIIKDMEGSSGGVIEGAIRHLPK
jgi:hypothetical protein